MPLPFDATLKDLVQHHTHDVEVEFGLAGPGPASVLNVDLSTVTASTDIVLGYGDPPERIVDLNFQSGRREHLPDHVLQYNALLRARFHVPVHSVVILLRPEADDPALTGRLEYQGHARKGKLILRYEVVRLWRRPVRRVLTGGVGTLPLAPLYQMPRGLSLEEALPSVIQRLAERIERETPPAEARRLLTATFVLTGLRLPRETAVRLFQGVRAMRESTTYQYILEEGQVEALQRMLLRQGRIRFGPPSEAVETVVRGISDLARLDRMCEAVVQVGSWQELLSTP